MPGTLRDETDGVGQLRAGHTYRSDEELDKAVHYRRAKISQEADMRNCFIEADA